MANAGNMIDTIPVRMMLVGYPGAGKTGALASLANAGYKLRILDFDGNTDPLLLHLDKRAYPNVDIVRCEDEFRNGDKMIEAVGIPHAFNDALKMMKHWTYEEDGETVDLGRSSEWGPDTVVVVDSLTTMGDAAFVRTLKASNRNALNCTHKIWGSAMADQENFLKIMRGGKNKFHLIVLTHLKLVGPDDVQADDDDTTKGNKEKVAQIVPFRLYPWCLGQKLSPKIGGLVPTMVLAESVQRTNANKRVLVTQPRGNIDLKFPVSGAPKELPIETGLLTLFEAMGQKAPGFGPTKGTE